jgi:hypothetical protein
MLSLTNNVKFNRKEPMGYTKLWNEIVMSSIWREDDKTRIVWITLLASSDSVGFVATSIPGLASASNVTLEDCKAALDKLLNPDPYSRCKDFKGRRLEEINGGYIILNYLEYRDKEARDTQKRREYMKKYMREKRAKDTGDVKIGHVSQEGRRQKAEADKRREEDAPADAEPVDEFIAYWNSNRNLPKVQAITKGRREKFNSRWKEEPFKTQWKEVIDTVAGSSFLTGTNDRGWKATFDWILANDSNYMKVLEGKYTTKEESFGPTDERIESIMDGIYGKSGNTKTE